MLHLPLIPADSGVQGDRRARLRACTRSPGNRVRRHGTTIGLRVGVNFQNINGKDADDNKLENDILIGFNGGINAEIRVAPDFYLQPGLLFSTKGAKSKDVVLGETIEGKIKIAYLEFPLNFIYTSFFYFTI